MCTVTLLPSRDGGFTLTSNRDEQKNRPTAAPVSKMNNGQQQVYPADGVSGGTWIAMNDQGRALCLLNGAFEAHEKQASYRKSRGLILLDLLEGYTTADQFVALDLTEIEPFTVISVELDKQGLRSEMRWDGQKKTHRILDEDKAYIWSSATLYSADIRALREKWFNHLLENKAETPTPKEILAWHKSQHSDDASNDLLMARDGANLSTVSVTQITTTGQQVDMEYHDLLKDKIFNNTLSLDYEHID